MSCTLPYINRQTVRYHLPAVSQDYHRGSFESEVCATPKGVVRSYTPSHITTAGLSAVGGHQYKSFDFASTCSPKASSRAAPSRSITTRGLPIAAAEHFSVPATRTKASTLRVRATPKASSRAAPSQLITTRGLPITTAGLSAVGGHQDESFDFARLPITAAEHFSVPGHQDESFDFASTCYTESVVTSCTLSTEASTLRVRATPKASSRAAPSQLITTRGLPITAAEGSLSHGHQDGTFDFASTWYTECAVMSRTVPVDYNLLDACFRRPTIPYLQLNLYLLHQLQPSTFSPTHTKFVQQYCLCKFP
ncbi:hypothetical protein R3P38DRAFT_3239696 [Favolaschia claudopus]|uniref:Uncharacterized protein n=1 Tax=Favolaschia claudopus TaxID=2862362 RepID=A0AAV9Z8G2_9AGAR